MLADSAIHYDPNFRLYMTTKLPNPHYTPEVWIRATPINFSVTFDGLQQRLLADVILVEKPEIEAQKDQIAIDLASDA